MGKSKDILVIGNGENVGIDREVVVHVKIHQYQGICFVYMPLVLVTHLSPHIDLILDKIG